MIQFPETSSIQKLKQVYSIEHFQQIISMMPIPDSFSSKYACYFRKGKTHLVCRCRHRQCKSRFIFISKDSQSSSKSNYYSLLKVNNIHVHKPIYYQGNKNSVDLIQQFIKQLPNQIPKSIKISIASKRLKIKKTAARYAINKLEDDKIKTFEELLNQYKDNYDLKYQSIQNQELPEILIIANQQMKNLFNLYGRVVTFDLTYSTIRQNWGNQSNRQYLLGFFTGRSKFYKPVIFSLVILKAQTKINFQKMLESFFEAMGGVPQTIISDHDKTFQLALRQLIQTKQYSCSHKLDKWHAIRATNVQKNKYQYLSKLLASKTKKQYQKQYKNISDISSQQQRESLLKLDKLRDRLCIPYVNSFIGLSCNDSMNQNLHNKLKDIISYRQPYIQVVKKTLIFIKKINIQCQQFQWQKRKYQNDLSFNLLKAVRIRVAKKIFHKFLEQFAQSTLFSSNKILNNQYEVFNNNGEKYKVYQQNGRWMCQCQYLKKIGIGCCHLIKILLLEGERIQDCIGPFWRLPLQAIQKIVLHQNEIKQNKSKTGPKRSRTNIIR